MALGGTRGGLGRLGGGLVRLSGGGASITPSVISGDLYVGGTLTSTTTGQWYRDGVAIGGETGMTYTGAAADIWLSGAVPITQNNGGGPSNAITFDADTYFPLSGIAVRGQGLTLADTDTTVDAWAAVAGGLKSTMAAMTAPAATNRPAYNPTSGPGGGPHIAFDGVDNVLTQTVTVGFSKAAVRMDVCGHLVGAQTLGHIVMRDGVTANPITFGVTAAPVARFQTSGTGGAVSVGTTDITSAYRMMTCEAISGASGSQTVSVNGGAAEDTDAITHAAWADGSPLSLCADSAGGTPTLTHVVGWAFHARSTASAVLDAAQIATLYALFQNESGVT